MLSQIFTEGGGNRLPVCIYKKYVCPSTTPDYCVCSKVNIAYVQVPYNKILVFFINLGDILIIEIIIEFRREGENQEKHNFLQSFIADSMLLWSAIHLPAISNAVPWSGDVLINGRPMVMFTPE